MSRHVFVISSMAVLAALPITSHANSTSSPPLLAISRYPRVDGSTSAQPLGTLAACRLTHTTFRWSRQFDYTRRLLPTTDAFDPSAVLSLAFSPRDHVRNVHTALYERIQHHGTHQSFTNLIHGSADLIIAARAPSADELALARQMRVSLRYTPVALDAFIFIVNRANSVTNLSIEQIRGIYTGVITNWHDVGGTNLPIAVFVRERNSGSQEKMEQLVMRGMPMTNALSLSMSVRMIGPYNALRDWETGIGYTVQYYDTYMADIPEVRALAVNCITPSTENIRARRYPYVTEVYVVWREGLPDDSPAASVRDWLLSAAGQLAVAESGYVPLASTPMHHQRRGIE